jgi:hypothetical protein
MQDRRDTYMKNIVCVFLTIICLLFCSCQNTIIKSENNEKSTNQNIDNFHSKTQDIIVPKIEPMSQNSNEFLKKAFNGNHDNFMIFDKLGNQYYGVENNVNTYSNEELLIDVNANSTRSLNFPDWQAGSGVLCILSNRYWYEWRSYGFDEQTAKYITRLTCIDSETGTISIVDEVMLETPLIYLCKIDDTHFLSFYNHKVKSGYNNEYATLSVAEMYDINGNKKTLINEVFENDSSWLNSKGILIEKFCVNANEIIGIGKSKEKNEINHFLMYYDFDGNLIQKKVLNNLSNVIGEEQVLKFVYLNDYFSIQTYESLTTYICKENNGTIELIAKGANGSLCFDVSGNNEYLYFIESNVNYDATLKQKECPLFVLNTLTGEIKALIINVSIDSPYFVSFDRLSSGELLFVYCEKIYDPMKMKHFISSEEELFSCLRDF